MPRQLAEFARVGGLQDHTLVRLDTEDMLSPTLKVTILSLSRSLSLSS